MIYANKREEIAEFLQKAAYNAWLMNKGSRMTSGKTDIEKGMASPTNRHTGTTCGILSRVNNKRHTPHKKMADRIRRNGQTRAVGE